MATRDVEETEPRHGIEMFEETSFNGVWNEKFLSGLVSDHDSLGMVEIENLKLEMTYIKRLLISNDDVILDGQINNVFEYCNNLLSLSFGSLCDKAAFSLCLL